MLHAHEKRVRLRNQCFFPMAGVPGYACTFFLSFIHLYLSDEQSQVGPSQLRS